MAAIHLHDDVVYDQPDHLIPAEAYCRRFHPLAALGRLLARLVVVVALLGGAFLAATGGHWLLAETPLDQGTPCPSGARSVLARVPRPGYRGLSYDRVVACEPRGPGEQAWRYE